MTAPREPVEALKRIERIIESNKMTLDMANTYRFPAADVLEIRDDLVPAIHRALTKSAEGGEEKERERVVVWLEEEASRYWTLTDDGRLARKVLNRVAQAIRNNDFSTFARPTASEEAIEAAFRAGFYEGRYDAEGLLEDEAWSSYHARHFGGEVERGSDG